MQSKHFRPTFLSMSRLILLAYLLLAVPVLAAPTETNPSDASANVTGNEDWYYDPTDSDMGVPSGDLGTNINTNATPFTTGVSADSTDAPNLATVQGCGGVGQADYTSALFNMPEVFEKFKRDVNSDLAKQILTYNYSMPQTAALFDTLNAYGNARYQQFQQACKLDSLKQDAKNQYMAACVKQQFPERKNLVQKAFDNAKNAQQQQQQQQQNQNAVTNPNLADAYSQDQLEAQAYAQAWEICGLQYNMDKNTIKARKDSDTAFMKLLRASENVNEAIKPLICAESMDSSNTSGQSCWMNLFLPQVRLCNGQDLSNGCKPSESSAGSGTADPATQYGVREPIIGVGRYFDLLRFIMINGVRSELVEKPDGEIDDKKVADGTLRTAAIAAANTLAIKVRKSDPSTEPTTKAFQQNYLNCRSYDLAYPVNTYLAAINKALADNGTTAADKKLKEDYTFDTSAYQQIITKQLTVPSTMSGEQNAVIALTQTALGCTANNIIPIFDPQITYNIRSCEDQEIDAFYTMASYDVSLAATRDVYRFMSLRLKQAYARLLNEKGAGINQTAAGGTTANIVDSVELRERLARVIKEVMLPSVETQLKRLDEIESSRGTFAKRIDRIYSTHRGCMFDGATSAK